MREGNIMSTTASLTHKKFNQVFTSDGYPTNVIPQIMKVKTNLDAGRGFNEDINMAFNDSPDDTLHYKYIISDDGSELSIRGYGGEDVRVAVIDLDVLFDMYTKDKDTFKQWLSDSGEYMEISPEELAMETADYVTKYNGNAFDYGYHMMAKCTVKRIENIFEESV